MLNDVQLSKFLSLILRHHPEQLQLTLDSDGWLKIDDLLHQAHKQGKSISRTQLEHVVSTNNKKRFQISEDGLLIRAVQGHSHPNVQRIYHATQPPKILYHGTAQHYLTSIQEKGLIAGKRHYVHLSADYETAEKVGKRHGQPIVFILETNAMLHAGIEFFQAENGVWLTQHVPVQFLSS